MNKKYIFIDPFNSHYSGVTSYINNAVIRLKSITNNIMTVEVVAKYEFEDLEDFEKRIYKYLENEEYLYVEFPESLGLSCNLKDQTRVHIRLHCGKTLGKYVQKIKCSDEEYNKEKNAIKKAAIVSSPSDVATEYTKQFYGIDIPVLKYPNPIEIIYQKSQKDIDVLFLGRNQYLKGKYFLEKISKRIEVNFLLPIQNQKNQKNQKKILFYENSEQKLNYLSRAKVVIVPSILDVYSMVCLEAIACRAHVVTWNHIGILDYIESDYITAIQCWNIEEFITSVNLSVRNFKMLETNNVIERINQDFDEKILSLLDGKYVQNLTYQVKNTKSLDALINTLPIDSIGGARRNILLRKIRKFTNNPVDFWRDSSFRNKYIKYTNKESINDIFSKSVESKKLESRDLKKDNLVCIENIKEIVSPLMHKSVSLGTVNSEEKTLIKLNFLDIPKPRGTETLFIYCNDLFVEDLLNNLKSHEDFSPFYEKNLRFLKIFNEFPDNETNIIDDINRWDLKTKEYISNYKNLIFIDVPVSFIKSMKYIGFNHDVISIITKNDREKKLDDLGMIVDCIIYEESLEFMCRKKIKKFFSYKNNLELSFYIRKIIQDNSQKDIDMLLPIYNGMCIDNVDRLNFESYQGHIFLKKEIFLRNDSLNFDLFLEQLSGHVSDILLRESIYLKYKDFCDNLSSEEDIKNLLKFLTRDGICLNVEI